MSLDARRAVLYAASAALALAQPLRAQTRASLPLVESAETALKPTPPSASADAQALLSRFGWKAVENDALVRIDGPEQGYIPGNYLKAAALEWRDGELSFTGGDAIPENLLPTMLEGLWTFVKAAKTPPIEAGKALAAWGLPPVIDGRKLVDPDGSATYYGQMLHLLYAEKPAALQRAGAERLSQALDLLHSAREQAFDDQSPDIAKTYVDRAILMLSAPARAGETELSLKPFEDVGSRIAGFEGELESDLVSAEKSGDADRVKDSGSAIEVLNALQRQRYDKKEDLPAVPAPGQAPPGGAEDDDAPAADAPPGAPVQLASGLPRLLRILDRVNGTPLTREQQKNLIESFPMGDLVWRLGAQDLWKRGFTGKGVKLAVIDGGIARHDELADAVKARVNLTAGRGKNLVDEHGTHVAGIIHALAPDAEIRGYTVFTNDNPNPALAEDTDALILKAIDQAVKDGSRIISMSLAGGDSPSNLVARKIESYAKKGVLFVVAAGNDHDKSEVESPSLAPNALTVGALDGARRAADFSSYGADFDAEKLKFVVKSIFMLPGTNIYSTVLDSTDKSGYMLMDGTSMATPALSGVAALLEQAAAMTTNPVKLSARVRDALVESSRPMSLDKLPSNVPFDQTFLVVRPAAALDALSRRAAPSVAKAD